MKSKLTILTTSTVLTVGSLISIGSASAMGSSTSASGSGTSSATPTTTSTTKTTTIKSNATKTTTDTASTTPATTKTAQATNANGLTANQQQHLQDVIAKGDQEITRRINSLNTLQAKVNAATKLTDSQKTALLADITTTITNLNTLKTQLDAETTITGALVDAKSIVTGYRVYALVLPKINMSKTADDQNVALANLTTISTKLQTRLTQAKAAGKTVTSEQTLLTDMQTQIASAQQILTTLTTNVMGLQPGDYNANHQVLTTYQTQLKTARTDLQAAYTDAKTIVADLQASKS